MYEVIFLFGLALIWIIIAVFQDYKTKEVANWLNFSLAIIALSFRFFYCLFNEVNFWFFYNGLIGLGIFFIFGNIFYYSKIFAGGDAKLMISLGTILPLESSGLLSFFSLMEFIIVFLVIGSLYSLFISLFLFFKNFSEIKKKLIIEASSHKQLIFFCFLTGILFIILSFFNGFLFLIGFLVLFFCFLYIYSFCVDEVCMIKEINPKELQEGDWLYQDVKLKNKGVIKSSWEGLTKQEINKLILDGKKVKIRQGIIFTPVFLISFILFILIKFLKINLLNNLWNSFW